MRFVSQSIVCKFDTFGNPHFEALRTAPSVVRSENVIYEILTLFIIDLIYYNNTAQCCTF